MKSHIRHVGFVSAFFHVTSRFQGLSVLSHVSALSLLWLMCSSIWMGHIMPVRSSVDGHLGYFHLLATVSNGAMNFCVQVLAWMYFLTSLEYMRGVCWLSFLLRFACPFRYNFVSLGCPILLCLACLLPETILKPS